MAHSSAALPHAPSPGGILPSPDGILPSPDGILPSRAGIFAAHLAEAGWLGLLVIVPLVMNVAGARTFEAAKLAAAAPIAAIMLLALIAAAIEREARLPGRVLRQPAFWAFAALTLCAITAAALSETPWLAFFGDYFRREGLVSWLVYATLFAALVTLLQQRFQLERVIDALLLTSVIPCVYAFQQRYGYDFFSTAGLAGGTTLARPGSNLGNPTFLSAYLLLIIPVTIARLVNTSGAWRVRAPWLLLLGAQIFAAILTQSRGPLLGLVAVLFLLAVVLGGVLRLRWLLLAALAAGMLVAVALSALNLTPDLQGLVKGTPLQRFIFTGGQDLTANSRIGIWGMGASAFLDQPLWRQIIGSGPDATHFNYFPHLPSWVMRIEGMTETIDRLHSESLETAMTLGLAGLAAQIVLLSSVVWLAAVRLGRMQGARAAVCFALACALSLPAGGLTLMTLMDGSRGLVGVGAGLGVAMVWSITLMLASWRGLASGRTASGRGDAVLVASLACALLGSWIESQVGVPTISIRLITAVYAALILLICLDTFDAAARATRATPAAPDAAAAIAAPARKRKRVKPDAHPSLAARPAPSLRPGLIGWMAGLALIVATAAYFPPLSGQVIHPPSPARLHLIIVPLLWLMAAAALFAWYEARRIGTPALDGVTRFLVWMVLPWFAFLVVYAQIGAAIRGATDAQVGERINALLVFAFSSHLVMVALLAFALYRGDSRRHAAVAGAQVAGAKVAGAKAAGAKAGRATALPDGWPLRALSTPAGIAALALSLAAGLGTCWLAMLDVRADTFAKLASWAMTQGRMDAGTAFYKTAAIMLPQERRFSGSYAARLIDKSAQELSMLPSRPELAPGILERLGEAQTAIERSLAAAPRDPWVTFAYANVHQFRGIGVLEKYQAAGERDKHVALARRYFEVARSQFPGHPWILRNWAQLEVDTGNRTAAYQKFDEMEKLDPQNTSVYSERLRFTRSFGDHAIAIASLRKGAAAQAPGSTGETELKLELARYFLSINQPQQALNVWFEIQRTQPDNLTLAANIAETYLQMGQRDLALGNAQAALARVAAPPRGGPAGLTADPAKARLEALVARMQAPAAPAAPAAPQSAPPAGGKPAPGSMAPATQAAAKR